MSHAVPAALAALLAATYANAAVTFFFDRAQFDARANTVLVADFEGFPDGDIPGGSPFGLVGPPGVTFSVLGSGGPPAIISPTFSGGTAIDVPSSMLTANGNEHFSILFSEITRPPIFAVGFDFLSNGFEPAVFTVFGQGTGAPLATLVVPQAPNTIGFIGIISTEDILGIEWLATGGEISNTAIDNIRATPAPGSTLALTLTALFTARRRRA